MVAFLTLAPRSIERQLADTYPPCLNSRFSCDDSAAAAHRASHLDAHQLADVR
jgi:hypothetical protein